ncbi:Transposable element Tcb1 transposase [Labeo rohita]|uniref:Transposable element Tcb1 transposase n=1 Tax=Labeo rohita TaxID=84645 RepID=A0ABQ8LVG0_LABRO|nr:Transposable element Tcb1 transposase [Labeo rohita]
MGKTADLAMVQKTITDTLHKDSKSQKVITEWGGCLQSAASKHIKCKVWKEEIGSGLKLKSVHQESPRSHVFGKGAAKPLLKQKQHQKHLTWAKEKMNWTVAQWSKVTSAGVGPLSFIKSKVSAAIYQEILEHFMLPSADKF